MKSPLAFALLFLIFVSLPASDATLSHLPKSLVEGLRSISATFNSADPDDDNLILDAPSAVLPPPRTKFTPRPEHIVITEEVERVVGEEGVELLRSLDGGDEASVIKLLLTEDDEDFQRKLDALDVPVSDMTKDEVVAAEAVEEAVSEQEEIAGAAGETEDSQMNGKMNLMGKMEEMKKSMAANEKEEDDMNMARMMNDEAVSELETAMEEAAVVSMMEEENMTKMGEVPEGEEMVMEENIEENLVEEEVVASSSEEVDAELVPEEPSNENDELVLAVTEGEDLMVVLPSKEGIENKEATPNLMVEEDLVVVLPLTDVEKDDVLLTEEVEEGGDIVAPVQSRSDEVVEPVTQSAPSGFFGNLFAAVLG